MAVEEEDATIVTEHSILSVLSEQRSSIHVKDLRKLCLDSGDKDSKKRFKRLVRGLEANGTLTLDESGTVTLNNAIMAAEKKNKRNAKASLSDRKKRSLENDVDDKVEKKKQEAKKKKKEAKRTSKLVDESDSRNSTGNDKDAHYEGEDVDIDKNLNVDLDSLLDKNKPCKGNPTGVTRLFVGNLPFAVDEESLRQFFRHPNSSSKGEEDMAVVTHIKWITDKETGKFYGSAFVEMRNSIDAAYAITNKNGMELLGRPIKINYAPAREGDIWPPSSSAATSNTTTNRQAGGMGIKAMSEKPEGCCKLFIGNLSYDIDDDTLSKFFGTVESEVKAVRWIHHKDSGDFKGVGFVEFWNTETCEKAATLHGKMLLGRPIRIDWTD